MRVCVGQQKLAVLVAFDFTDKYFKETRPFRSTVLQEEGELSLYQDQNWHIHHSPPFVKFLTASF